MRILYHPKRILGFETYVAPEGFDRKAQPVDIYDVFERYYKNHRTAKWIVRATDTIAPIGSYNADEVVTMNGTSYRYGYELSGAKYSVDLNLGNKTLVGSYPAGNYDTITVNNTTGFPDVGRILLGQVNIGKSASGYSFTYTSKDSTHFYGTSQTLKQPVGAYCNYIIQFPTGSIKRYIITNHTSTTPMNCPTNGQTGVDWLYCGNLVNSVQTSDSGALTSTIKYIHIHKLDNITTYGYCAHYGSLLTGRLYLSNSATLIGQYLDGPAGTLYSLAFDYCRYLTGELIIPDSIVAIGVGSFRRQLGTFTSLVLGNSVVTIWDYAFSDLTELNGTLTIPNSCTTIKANAFAGCSKLDTLDLGTGVQTIGNSAFQYCSQLSGTLTLPDTLTTIGILAFYGCTSFTGTLTIPANITSIGQGAFGDDNFSDIDITANAGYEDVDDVLYEISTRTALHSVKGDTGTITFQTNTLILGDYCCLRNQRTGTLTVPDSVTRIGVYAFYECDGFTALVLETSDSALEMIDDDAFGYCSNIAGTLTIPNSVTLIDIRAFRYCVKITALSLGSGLVTIGNSAFDYMSGLAGNIVIPNSVETIGVNAFYGNSATNGTLTLGTGLKTIGAQAFAFNPLTGTLTIPSAVTAIGEAAFVNNNFSAVASSALGFTVSDYVLYDETVSAQIKAHTSVRGYSGTLTFKAGTTSILSFCFYDNDNRSGAIVIPYTVTAIGQQAFQGCGGFNAAVVIGDGTNGSALTTIGYLAFYDVDNVTRYDFYRTPAPLCNTAGSFGASPAKELHITSGATGYDVTPATAAAPWTNTAIFSSVTADL